MALEAVKERHQSDTVLLVVDPKSEFNYSDENKEGQRFIRSIRAIIRKVGATVLVIDHTRKATLLSKRGSAREIRGDSKYPAAYDTVLALDKNADGTILATWAKAKDAPRLEALILRFNAGTDETPGDFRFKVVCRKGEEKSAIERIKEGLMESLSLGKSWMTKGQIVAETGLAASTVNHSLARMVKAEVVERDGPPSGSMALYRLVEGAEEA
jgi:hypothetical protein